MCHILQSDWCLEFLNRDKLDVHDSPDPLSLPGCVGGAGYETSVAAINIDMSEC